MSQSPNTLSTERHSLVNLYKHHDGSEDKAAFYDGVAVIELSAPPANCYSYEMMQQIDAAVLNLRMDESIHVVVITGAGEKFFCAGADIAMLNGVTPEFKYNFCLHANETLCRLEQTNKLIIAAINGHCVGGGLEVALACDMRIARRAAGKIGLPEVKLGVLPGTGGTVRLPRVVGKSKAIEMMVEAASLSADEALQIGLVNKAYEATNAADFRRQVLQYAAALCPPKTASMATGHIKRSVQSGAEMSLHDHLSLERELQQRLFTSSDAKEGLAAYVEKRTAHFTGR